MHSSNRGRLPAAALLSIVLVGILTMLPVGKAMAFFDFFTIYVFSEVNGVVTMNGKPVQGAQVIRVGDHEEDKVYTDTTVTDDQGRFAFGPISTFSLRPMMLGTIIRQKMTIKYQGVEYIAWETTKTSNYRYGELNDEGVNNPIKLDLLCELTESQGKRTVLQLELGKVGIYGLCSIKGKPGEGK